MNNSVMRQAMDELVADPPPSTVDFGRAVQDGTGKRRRNRIWGVVAAGVGVLALIGGTAAIAGALPDGSTGDVASTRRDMTAPTAFDPGVKYAEFGWAPDAVPKRTFEVTPKVLTLFASGAEDKADAFSLQAWFYAAGVDIQAESWGSQEMVGTDGSPAFGSKEAAPDVAGHSAYWWTTGSDVLMLRWEYAPGAWAETAAVGFPEADISNILYRVAENIQFGGEPLALPFDVGALPDGYRLQSAEVGYDLQAAATVGDDPQSPEAGDDVWLGHYGRSWPDPDAIQIAVKRNAGPDTYGFDVTQANEEINGHKALIMHGDSFSLIRIYNVDGYHISVNVNVSETSAQLGNEGVEKLAASVKIKR